MGRIALILALMLSHAPQEIKWKSSWPEALKEIAGLVASGRIRYRETVAQGIAAAPEAFFGLLKGRNFGKQLIKLT